MEKSIFNHFLRNGESQAAPEVMEEAMRKLEGKMDGSRHWSD